MVGVPTETPPTIPVGPTVASALLLLVQLPPGTDALKVVRKPVHTLGVPDTAGCRLTVIGVVAGIQNPKEYVITGLPAETPVTIPEELPTVAKPTLLLDHEPPAVGLANVIVAKGQTLVRPVFG
jgi:hypothetical protein